MSLDQTSFREVLRTEFSRRQAQNSMYSMRAFARDIGLRPNRISEVLNGQQGISLTVAKKISNRLGFSDSESNHFFALVESCHARRKRDRLRAQSSLNIKGSSTSQFHVAEKVFSIISNWYCFAIVELSRAKYFQSNIDWISRALNINKSLVKDAVEKLLSVGLLEKKNQRWCPSSSKIIAEFDIPSRAIQNYHSQILGKAQEALTNQPLQKREFNVDGFLLSKEKVFQLKKEIRKFHMRLVNKYEAKDGQGQLYAFSSQLFQLTGGLDEEIP